MERAYREPAVRFTAFIREIGSKSKPWQEEYIEETDDPDAFARQRCEQFNINLKDGEVLREVMYVIRRGRCAPVHHKWEKQNLVTLSERGGRFYDQYRCPRCGCTGKRYGLASHVARDSKYLTPEYERCDTAVAHQQKAHKKIAKKVMDEEGAKEEKRRVLQAERAAKKKKRGGKK